MMNDILSGIPSYPHNEINEDDKQVRHPGYEARDCKQCGIKFIVAYGSFKKVCGREKCGEKSE